MSSVEVKNARRDELQGAYDSLSEDSVVVPRPLEMKEELDGMWLVGSPLVRRFVEVDRDGAAAIRALQGGKSLAHVKHELLEESGEEYDLPRFVRFLGDRDLIETIDGQDVGHQRWKDMAPVSPFDWRFTWIRHPLLWALLAAAIPVWFVWLMSQPAVIPRIHHLHVVDRPLLSFIIAILGLISMALVHEFAHWAMARSYGLRSPIKVSNRWYVIVLETDVTNSWMLPVRQRIAIFLAGMGYNITAIMALTVTAAYGIQNGWWALNSDTHRWLLFFTYCNVIPIIFQFFIFARTDLYYVLLAVTGERNLAQDARQYSTFRLLRRIRRIMRRPTTNCLQCNRLIVEDDPFCLGCGADVHTVKQGEWSFRHQSLRKLPWVSLIFGLGQLWMIVFFIRIVPRIQILYWNLANDAFDEGLSGGGLLPIAEALGVIALQALQMGLLVFLIARRTRSAMKRPLAVSRALLAHARGAIGKHGTNKRA